MIVYFKVKNYKSIKDMLTLSFVAAPISEHAESNLIEKDKLKLVKTISIYGHNASGKSNILDAIVFFRWIILNSTSDYGFKDGIDVEPFELNTKTSTEPSFFEMAFYIGNTKYRYGFEAKKKVVLKEWLLETKKIKENQVFLRINNELDIVESRFKNSQGLDRRVKSDTLFLTVCSKWNVKKAISITDWFGNIITIHGLLDNQYREDTIKLIENDKYSNLVIELIKKVDLGVESIDLLNVPIKIDDIIDKIPEKQKEIFSETWEEREEKTVIMYHKQYDENNNEIGSKPFILDKSESEGTKKYFNIIGILIKAIISNRVVIADELDARFHTLLTKSILKLFNSNRIKSESQLILAGHDTALLDKRILRRDQINFVEKDKYGASKLVSLVEYKPRKESPYDKNYLEGKYGGIPFIDDIESIFNNL